jgi:hypothetical protein
LETWADEEKLEFLRQIVPTVAPNDAPQILTFLDLYAGLRRKKHRSAQEIIAVETVRRQLGSAWEDVRKRMDQMLTTSGADELVPALEAGILTIDPLIQGEEFDLDLFLHAFVDQLASMLTHEHTYPLFDDFAGDLARAQIAEGMVEPAVTTSARGSQVAAAANFMSRLPAFPEATVADVLQVREDLRDALVRFRAGIANVTQTTERPFYEPGFRQEVEQIYVQHVAPSLLEIQESVRANAYLRRLLGAAVGDMQTILTGVITLAVTQAADLPPLIAGGAAALTTAARAAWEKSEGAKRVHEQQFYFLYRMEELLA